MRNSTSLRRPSGLILAGVAAGSMMLSLGACDRVRPKAKPAPPPPSEKVPDAPGPDNTVRELPPASNPEPKASSPRAGGSVSQSRPLGLGPR